MVTFLDPHFHATLIVAGMNSSLEVVALALPPLQTFPDTPSPHEPAKIKVFAT